VLRLDEPMFFSLPKGYSLSRYRDRPLPGKEKPLSPPAKQGG
jgi:hypothetical protein